jgi:hypothetical protein
VHAGVQEWVDDLCKDNITKGLSLLEASLAPAFIKKGLPIIFQ